ncbi:MAG: hypothetical protein KatS3mg002_1216 [Candidatus Woesearchaeota archaeon]|nr:MAG: hypothetical protein KatS3mg002_1216 [Candidatus Woesearchaeota archaeon]
MVFVNHMRDSEYIFNRSSSRYLILYVNKMKKKYFNKTKKSSMIFSFLLLLILNIMFMPHASAIVISNIIYEPVINESDYINISFYANNYTGNVSYEIYLEGSLISDKNYYYEKTDYSSSGIYEYTVLAKDNISSAIENFTINVLDVPLVVQILSPINNSSYNSSNISIVVSTNQETETNCNYDVSGKSGVLISNSTFNISPLFFYQNILLNNGSHDLEITCETSTETKSSSVSFSIVTEVVEILSKTYSLTSNNGVSITLETNYDSECRYSLIKDTLFSSMDKFTVTNNIIHKTIINGLSEGGHRIYVACASSNSLVRYDEINVIVSTRPSASIKIDKSGPLKKGIYSITLTTSKEVQNNPSLYYILDNDDTKRRISLTGSGKNWNGYLVIEDGIGTSVATFKFSGTDFNGIIGDIITDGEIFLIDTDPPSQVEELSVVLEEKGVLLSWLYRDDDSPVFKIYRSEVGESQKYELIADTSKESYLDKDISAGKHYSYKILAVDKAGNEGPFSDEVEIYIPIIDEKENNVVKTLDKTLYYLVDEKISLLETMLMDIDSAERKLSSIKDPSILKIIELLNVEEISQDSRSEIENIISELEDLKNQDLSKSELEIRLNSLKLKAIKAQGNVVDDIIIQEQGSFEQIITESDVESSVMDIIEGINISKEQLEEYMIKNKGIQDNVLVKVESISFKIRNLNQESYDKKTLIHKKIIVPSKLSNVILVEKIPKEVINKASEIVYLKTQNPEIVKEDPVVKWNFDSFESGEIYYLVDGIISLMSLKNTKTLIMDKPNFKISDSRISNLKESNKITGLMSFENISFNKITGIHWIIIIGVIMIVLLGGYVIVLDRQDKKFFSRNIHNINKSNSMNRNSNSVNGVFGLRSIKTENMNSKKNTIYENGVQSKLNNSNNNLKSDRNTRTSVNANLSGVKIGFNSTNSLITNIESIKSNNSSSNYTLSNNNFNDILPEDIIRKIDYCNSVINMFDYERARSIYNETVKLISNLDFYNDYIDENHIKKLNHVKKKLEAYMYIHNARRHLYYKRLKKYLEIKELLNKNYGDIAYNIGFIPGLNTDSELKYLNYVANNIKQLEFHHEKISSLNQETKVNQ